MGKLMIGDDDEPSLKRCRTDSGYGDLSQSCTVGHEDKLGSGTRACSPILLSDEPEVTITEEVKPLIREPTIVVYLGSVRQQIAQSKYLSHIWKSGLDSPCAVCHQDFSEKGDPPIRTFTFEASEDLGDDPSDVTQLPLSPHPIRVFNRHFKCLISKRIKYIPISHVWHEVVSQAQVARVPTLNAIRLGYQVPIRSLLALTRQFGNVEIWHDYISVPQWQTTTQQQLLLQLPNIFSYPDRMVMHLYDVSPSHLKTAVDPPSYGAFLESAAKLTNSRYFERMWVVLEYIQSKEAIVMSQYYDIFDKPAAELCDLIGENMSKYLSRLGQSRFNELALTKSFFPSRRACWADQQTWKMQDPGLRTLGAAMFIIGQKLCRDYHDYFFALRFLLDLRQDGAKINTILSDDAFASHLALCCDALKSGDYSPLLFLPPASEQPDPRAPWLRGHSGISHDLWDYGTCRQSAASPLIINEGRIAPELESIGVMRSFEPYDFPGSAESIFHRVAKKIIDVSYCNPEAFHDAISRIFPSAARKGVPPSIINESGSDSQQLADLPGFQDLLEHLTFVLRTESIGAHRIEAQQASKKLLSLLGLALPEKQSSLSRIRAAAEEAHWYGRKLEGLATVQCKGCGKSFLFRATVWDAAGAVAAAQMYRIPGLLYEDTVAEGVGLVVAAGGRIVGKMAYATPACKCRIRERVEIESRSSGTD